MEFVVFALVIAAIVAARIVYGKLLEHGMRARIIDTSLSPDALRQIFVQKVVGSTWKLVDDDPMVAQSPLIAGIRQQIYLDVVSLPTGRSQAVVGVARWSMSSGIPAKAHTIRMRLDAFERSVIGQDPAAGIETQGLRVEVRPGAPGPSPAGETVEGSPAPTLAAQDPWPQLEHGLGADSDLGASRGSGDTQVGDQDVPSSADPQPLAPTLVAGWYRDPRGAGMRWWDGTVWTDATSPVD